MGQISIDFQNKPSINAEYTRLTLHEYISKPFKAVIDCNINKQSAGSKSEFISNPLSYIVPCLPRTNGPPRRIDTLFVRLPHGYLLPGIVE